MKAVFKGNGFKDGYIVESETFVKENRSILDYVKKGELDRFKNHLNVLKEFYGKADCEIKTVCC